MNDNIVQEIIKLEDERLCVLCFCKEYRPEEQEKLKKIKIKLNFYKSHYPDKWQAAAVLMAMTPKSSRVFAS